MRTLLLPLAFAACGSPSNTPEDAPEAVVVQMDASDPETCEDCHSAVVSEWRESMHAQAHHEADPIYGAMRSLRMHREGDAIAGKCAQCHNPLDPADTTSEAAHAGVACGACHAVEAVDTSDGKRGARALTFAEGGVLRGPHAIGDAAPHPASAPAEHLTDGRTVCMACHDSTKNPAGVDTCTTGPENAGMGGASCTACHMPRVAEPSGTASTRPDHASHQFQGPHRLWLQDDPGVMANAVALAGTLAGDTLTVRVSNLSGHAFPSGFPGRMGIVMAVGTDASGAEVWRNITSDPMAESPDAVFNKVYVDAEGKPTMPPFGVELARDSRLTPAETRVLLYTVPESVASVDVKMVFRLAPPPAFEAWGLAGTALSEPRVIETAQITR